VVEHVITQFWVIPPKITFFSKNNKNKIKQRLAAWRKQAGESSCNFVFILKKKSDFWGNNPELGYDSCPPSLQCLR